MRIRVKSEHVVTHPAILNATIRLQDAFAVIPSNCQADSVTGDAYANASESEFATMVRFIV